MSDVRKEAAGFINDYGYEPEEDDSNVLKEVFRAANIMKRLLDDQFDLHNHVAYLEGVVRHEHRSGVTYLSGKIECQCGKSIESVTVHIAELLKWPRP